MQSVYKTEEYFPLCDDHETRTLIVSLNEASEVSCNCVCIANMVSHVSLNCYSHRDAFGASTWKSASLASSQCTNQRYKSSLK